MNKPYSNSIINDSFNQCECSGKIALEFWMESYFYFIVLKCKTRKCDFSPVLIN